jgi:hypothetical protein
MLMDQAATISVQILCYCGSEMQKEYREGTVMSCTREHSVSVRMFRF